MRFPQILSWALNELHSIPCGTCVHPWSLNSVVFERIGSSRDLVCNDFLCFGAYFYSRPSLRLCSKLPPFTKKGEGLLRDSSGWTSFFSREADHQSVSAVKKAYRCFKHRVILLYIVPVPRQSHQSEAATKTISDWAIRSSPFSRVVWNPRRREILCGSRSSRFPLFHLRFFRIPAFILIERAALNRIFCLFSVGKAG